MTAPDDNGAHPVDIDGALDERPQRVRTPWRQHQYEIAGEVSVEEAVEILRRYNASHWRGRAMGEVARYSIPANPRRDDDIRLGAFIRRAELAFEDVARLRATLDVVRVLVADPELSHEATTAAVLEALGGR